MGGLLILVAGAVFLVVLFIVVRLRARTHEEASPITEEPPDR
jgi:hypothetical protein